MGQQHSAVLGCSRSWVILNPGLYKITQDRRAEICWELSLSHEIVSTFNPGLFCITQVQEQPRIDTFIFSEYYHRHSTNGPAAQRHPGLFSILGYSQSWVIQNNPGLESRDMLRIIPFSRDCLHLQSWIILYNPGLRITQDQKGLHSLWNLYDSHVNKNYYFL